MPELETRSFAVGDRVAQIGMTYPIGEVIARDVPHGLVRVDWGQERTWTQTRFLRLVAAGDEREAPHAP